MSRSDHFRLRSHANRALNTCVGREAYRSYRSRDGVLTLELIMTLPILLAVGLATVQFSMMLLGSQAISAAAYSGVRTASLPGTSAISAFDAVHHALDGWSFQNDVEVLIFVNDQPELTEPLIAATTGDKVSVTVRVKAAKVAPNALRLIGISIADTDLQQTFVMRKE